MIYNSYQIIWQQKNADLVQQQIPKLLSLNLTIFLTNEMKNKQSKINKQLRLFKLVLLDQKIHSKLLDDNRKKNN